MKTKLFTGAAIGLALAASSYGQGTIDSFDTLQFIDVVSLPGATNSNSQAAPEALSGERDLRIHRVGPGLASLSADVGLSFPNTVSLACGFGVIGSLHLVYDGFDNSNDINYTGLGGLDLTEGGTLNAIKFSTASDLGATINVTVYQDATHYSVASISVAADPTFTFVDVVIGMSQFVPAGPDGGADFANVGAVEFEIGDGPAGADISLKIIGRVHDPKFDPPPPPSTDPFCQKTQGYWKNHEEAWPVTSLTLGSVTYTQTELLALLNQSTRGNASLILAHQLIAALLNLASGSDASSIQAIVDQANDLLAQYPGSLPYDVPKCSPERSLMIELGQELDTYNNSCEDACGDSSSGTCNSGSGSCGTDSYGGSSYGGSSYGGSSYGGKSYGGKHYGGSSYGGKSYGGSRSGCR